jgi:D-specific alpha-keto acid dehydrogenase
VPSTDPTRVGLAVYGCEPDEAELFRGLGPRFGVRPTTTSDALSEANAMAVRGNRCVSVGHKSEIGARVLHALKDTGVDYISTRSIGLNHIDLDAAARVGITVENVTYAPDGVADFTVMLMLMAIRNAKATVTSANNYDFRLGSIRGRELRDMTVGVVGVGNIGHAVIRRLRGFGCRVLACNGGVPAVVKHFVSLDELLAESDIVTLHLPLTTETHHLVGREEIAAMKPGACLVNTGRGALVDTDALLMALEAGALGGAALDVLEGEEGLFYFDCRHRSIDDRRLLRLQCLPNVIITPHTAYYTGRALHDVVEQTLVKCRAFESSRANA